MTKENLTTEEQVKTWITNKLMSSSHQ